MPLPPSRSSHRSPGTSRGRGRPSAGGGRGRPGGGRGGSSSSPRTPQVSALETALTASADLPLPTAETFAEMGLPATLVDALQRRGITTPTAVQLRTLPDALAGRDVLGRAQTGSGKTLAFGLPLLARLAADGGRSESRRPRGLVLVPTRELAEQVKDALAPLGSALGIKVTAVYGGASMGRQVDALGRGAHLVVATPGRLEDHLSQGTARLDGVEITVLDEADHMADLGFLPAVTRLLEQPPAGGQRLLFSATVDRGVERLVTRWLSDPALHAVATASSPVENMDHQAFTVRRDDKTDVIAEITARPGRTLLFVRTKRGADRLAKQLSMRGVNAGAIHGDLRQGQRQRALDAFASGRARVLVATDVAARGIHVDDIDLVVHVDPPNDAKDYLHRSGRTARAGASGTVLSLLLSDEVAEARRLFAQASISTELVSVSPGAPPVRELAESGETIVVVPEAPRRERSSERGEGGPRGPRGRSGGRPGAPRSGAPRSGAPRSSGPHAAAPRTGESRPPGVRSSEAPRSSGAPRSNGERRSGGGRPAGPPAR